MSHIAAERNRPARAALEDLVQLADGALADGTIDRDEHALIAGGARQVIERL
jgi:hypothetical protein